MRRAVMIFMAFCAIGFSGCYITNTAVVGKDNVIDNNITPPNINTEINLNLPEGSIWGGVLRASTNMNAVTMNGTVSPTAGYNIPNLLRHLAGSKIRLEINTGNSTFSENRLFKLTLNQTGDLIEPDGVKLIGGEYVPANVQNVVFTVPAAGTGFDGTLGFTFAYATLDNFKITAYQNRGEEK
jgi:hypothetical protein